MTEPRTKLFYGKRQVCEVVPDEEYSAMWRVAWPGGAISDMANIARAKDAAMIEVRTRGLIPHPTKGALHWK